jgi:hypothetical protein
MIDISILRAMVAAGAPVEAVLAAVEADQLAEGVRVQARRLKDRDRQRLHRHADIAESHTVTRSHSDTALSLSLSSSLLSVVSEGSKEGSKEVKTVVVEGRKRKTHLPDDWTVKATHYEKANKRGFSESQVDQKADDMRNWAKSKGIMRVDWDATFHGFIRPRENAHGFGGPRPLQDDSKSISRAAGRLAERAERGEQIWKPRPSLLPQDDSGALRLLPKR